MRLIAVGLLMMFVIKGCSEQKRQTSLYKKVVYQPFLFNMQQYFSDHEYNMSFPIWFNDKVLKQKKIKEIRLNGFPSSLDIDVIEDLPKHKKVYSFNEQGDLLSAHFEQFYENTKVGSYLFEYLTAKDENGFSKVEKTIGLNSDQKSSEYYFIYEKEKCGNKTLIYRDEFSGDYLFYMLNEKNWGALSIDSIFNPTIEDKIILGTPSIPYKSYRVENIVNELNVVNFKYDKAEEFVQEIEYDEYPFRNKRVINYDENGICFGFVDSAFSGNKFLKSELIFFEMEEGLPVKIINESKSNNSASSYFHVETIEYIFFK